MSEDVIYHLVPQSEFKVQCERGQYNPARFEADGFIHCTADLHTLVAVANDYFGSLGEPLLVLRISVSKLRAPVRYETAAPIAGAGVSHLDRADLSPHVYGPLNLDAATGAAFLVRRSDGKYDLPARFLPLDEATGLPSR